MRIHYLYKATNRKNGKAYVGVSQRPLQRIADHEYCAQVRGYGYHFPRAVRKYGIQSFAWEILDYHYNEPNAYRLEKWWIRKCLSYFKGYNMNGGGRRPPRTKKGCGKGKPKSEQHRRRIGEAQRGVPKSAQQIAKKSKAVVIDGITYPSRKAAAEALGNTAPAIGHWLKNGKAQYA